MTVTIDSCYNSIISKLTDQGEIFAVSKKLLSFTTNDERVVFVHETLKKLKLLPTLLKVDKTENVSTFYRNHGNKCFQMKQDYKAWQYYNLSLLHAPMNSRNFCLALSNRTAVLHSLKKYEDCLQDIEHVFLLQYPEGLKEKLVKRQNSCKESLINKNNQPENFDKDIKNILALEKPTDPRFTCASSKIEVVCNNTMGRHVRAKEDINVGDILVQENPYFTLLLKDQFLFSCSYCLSRKSNLLPCDKCCFSLYCNKKCKAMAWKDYHEIECALMPTLIEMEFTKIELLALRTVIKARNDHACWQDLFKTIETTEKNFDNDYRGCVKLDDKWVYDSKYYSSIHSLATNIEKRSISDIFQKCVTAAVFLHLLSKGTEFLNPQKDTDVQKICKCVAGNLLLHNMTSPTNMHSLTMNTQNQEGDYTDEIDLASAPYAFHSLINHSCAPNVVRFQRNGSGEMKLIALRPLKKGMQLFDNYGFHHALQDRTTRQKALNAQYKFTCLCEACANNWPTYLTMQPSRNIPLTLLNRKEKLLNPEAIENLKKGDKGTALKLYKPLTELLVDLERFAPCVELSDCQESFKQCLLIFEDMLIPYGQSNLVEWSARPPKV